MIDRFVETKSWWEKMVQTEEAGHNFDITLLTPGKFCLHIYDGGGESMSCYTEMEVTGYFDNIIDAMGYLRFVEIPRILNWDTDTDKLGIPNIADSYLLQYEPELRKEIDHVIGLLDKAITAGTVSGDEMDKIKEEFNNAFCETDPSIQILAWGSLSEVLSSEHFNDIFEEDVCEEEDEEQEEKQSTELKRLLDNSEFDENNTAHMELASYFLDRHQSY